MLIYLILKTNVPSLVSIMFILPPLVWLLTTIVCIPEEKKVIHLVSDGHIRS